MMLLRKGNMLDMLVRTPVQQHASPGLRELSFVGAQRELSSN